MALDLSEQEGKPCIFSLHLFSMPDVGYICGFFPLVVELKDVSMCVCGGGAGHTALDML